MRGLRFTVFCYIRNMKKLIFAFSLMLVLGACQSQPQSQSGYCTVKGNIKGVRNGTKLELQDEYDSFKVIETVRVKDGAYEFHPCVAGPTHVYLYIKNGLQLKDFILEPGTIVADVDATDEDDYAVCATGTPSNDFLSKIDSLYDNGDKEAFLALRDEVLNADETGILGLYLAGRGGTPACKGLRALEHLSPDFASMPYVAALREELARRAKTEPAPEGSETPNCFIDMEFPDANGNLISLSSVVNDPANRYVLLDFWATWCSPCRESIPVLKDLYAKYHEMGLEIYSVSEDVNEKNWKSFLPENGMDWINVRDDKPGRQNSKAWFDYALHGIPTMLLLDGETGEILLRDHMADFDATLSALL